ncbi:MAG: acetoacetate decarboxylase family protein [Deltaproteobacteria bacterium]|nr:acetoacetate decarboxylase family protein [Deltaproteobacteria bacterium]
MIDGDALAGDALTSEALLAELRKLPLFADLEHDVTARLLELGRRERVPAGKVFLAEEAAPDDLYLLLRGEVAVRRNDRLVTLLPAPQALGLLSLVDGKPRSASLSAFTEVELLVLERRDLYELMGRSPALGRSLVQHFATEVRTLYEAENVLRRHFEDFFESPNARLVPGPYVADAFEMVFLVMRDDPARLRRLLPDGLRPLPGLEDRYFLTFSFFPRVATEHPAGRGKAFAYDETCPFLPCLGPSLKPGVYTPELYPENFLAITLGRELYGFPKRFGKTERYADHIDVILAQEMLLRASWRERQPLEAPEFGRELAAQLAGPRRLPTSVTELVGALFGLANRDVLRLAWPAVTVYLHKQIPDVTSEAERRPVVDQLVEVPFRVRAMERFFALRAPEVRFFASSYFLGGECVGGFSLTMSFVFGRGRVALDYLARAKASSLGDRVRRLIGRE